ncbi:MAG: thioredoxin family protein [Bacteroidota bacterium]
MKRSILLSLVLSTIFIISISFMANSNFQEIAINSPIPMPDYKMKDVSGKEISLNEAKTAKGLLVIFSCNTCPYVKLSESRIKDLSSLCAANQIGCILINSNEAQRGEEDSFDEMVKYYNGQGLKCYYSVDIKSQLANAFGATRTPQCFLFNNKGLIYKGAIDDNVKDPAAVKDAYLKNAIEALAKSGIPTTQETKSIGCTIKRLE